jgi:hypothetical protein
LSRNDGNAIVIDDDFGKLKFMLSSGLAKNEQCQQLVTTVCSSKTFCKSVSWYVCSLYLFLNICAARATGSTGKLKNIFYHWTEHYRAGSITGLYAVGITYSALAP